MEQQKTSFDVFFRRCSCGLLHKNLPKQLSLDRLGQGLVSRVLGAVCCVVRSRTAQLQHRTLRLNITALFGVHRCPLLIFYVNVNSFFWSNDDGIDVRCANDRLLEIARWSW